VNVSVVLCTYNPNSELLGSALTSLERQTLRDFEVVLVDNNSTPPINGTELAARYRLNLRVLREERPGLTYARCTGIAASSGDLIVFVDDDNSLDSDYLEQAVRIAVQEPTIGHFGGIARAGLARPIPPWKEKLLPHLGVRDYGNEPITAREDYWGHWEPIGAGMVTRRDVAQYFVTFVSREHASARLGRRGASLMSGEDSLMARAAFRLGYFCSYQPALKLTHFMKPSRLRASVLVRTLQGHGRSYVVLERVLQRKIEPPRLSWIARELTLRYLHRVRTEGLAVGTITWFWDIGYMRQAKQPE
jgi:glycosyltransferase involved in cell wall biosynthesis